MSGLFLALLCELVALAAPVVCLFYRKGWFLTPDDPVSPFGSGTTPGASTEPFVQRIYARFGVFAGDYWWLGLRNRAYGLSYALKPRHFKQLTTYTDCQASLTERGPLRTIAIDGYAEYTLRLGFFHVIAGYRLRPIYDWIMHNRIYRAQIPYRPVNMDARPILSVRWGTKDD